MVILFLTFSGSEGEDGRGGAVTGPYSKINDITEMEMLAPEACLLMA